MLATLASFASPSWIRRSGLGRVESKGSPLVARGNDDNNISSESWFREFSDDRSGISVSNSRRMVFAHSAVVCVVGSALCGCEAVPVTSATGEASGEGEVEENEESFNEEAGFR